MNGKTPPYGKKKWGNSIVFFNLAVWNCMYCGNRIKDDVPFGIIKIAGEYEPEVFCCEECLKIYILKEEAKHMNAHKDQK